MLVGFRGIRVSRLSKLVLISRRLSSKNDVMLYVEDGKDAPVTGC